MKTIFFAIAALVFISAPFARAATVEDAVYDSSTQILELSLFYNGGLKAHSFSLNWDQCQTVDEIRQIAARLIDSGWDDTGTDEIRQKLRINLSSMRCKPAELTIFSDKYSGATLWID